MTCPCFGRARSCCSEMTERAEEIKQWEERGWLVPECGGCREFYDSPGRPMNVFAPHHQPSPSCRSGKRPHCTCDTCF